VSIKFTAGSYIPCEEGDVLSFLARSGSVLLSCSIPQWLDRLRLWVDKYVPETVIVPVGVPVSIGLLSPSSFEWNLGNKSDAGNGSSINLPAFDHYGSGYIRIGDQERAMVAAAVVPSYTTDVPNILAPFRFDGLRCTSAYKLEFGWDAKKEGHFFFKAGDSGAITVNGVSNCPLYLNLGVEYEIVSDKSELTDSPVIATSAKMDGASVVARLTDGFFVLEPSMLHHRSLWHGLEGVPYSGGKVLVSKESVFGREWASGFGHYPPRAQEFAVPSAGQYCIINYASMHSWCCSLLDVKVKKHSSYYSIKTAYSGLANFNGLQWRPADGVDRLKIYDKIERSIVSGASVAVVEPGVMDGYFKLGNDIISICRDFLSPSSGRISVGVASIMPQGLSSDSLDSLKPSLDMAAANTLPGTFLAVFISPTADELSLSVLRSLMSTYGREVFAFVTDHDTAVAADTMGMNMLVTDTVAPILPARAGRRMIVIDSGNLYGTP
jgi:hypothetical protein